MVSKPTDHHPSLPPAAELHEGVLNVKIAAPRNITSHYACCWLLQPRSSVRTARGGLACLMPGAGGFRASAELHEGVTPKYWILYKC